MNSLNNKEEYYYPMLVSYAADVADDEMTFFRKWEEFDNLSESKKDFLTSKNLVVAINNTCNQFDLDDKQSAELTRIVRDVVFGKIPENTIRDVIINKLQPLDQEKILSITKTIQSNILKVLPIESVESRNNVKSLAKLSLSQALKQYPKLEEQKITDGLLKLRYSEFPSRPTIKNWITDYYQNLGVGNHGIMERGNFLFHSENCKKLPSPDRQKLALIFKSLSENMPLVIDTERQEIVFPDLSHNTEQESHNVEHMTQNIEHEINPKSEIQSPKLNVADQSSLQGKQIQNYNDNNNKSDNRYPPASLREALRAGQISDTRKAPDTEKGEVRFFSGQAMQPSPPLAANLKSQIPNPKEILSSNDKNLMQDNHMPGNDSQERVRYEMQDTNNNSGNLSFSSAQKMPAEQNEPPSGFATMRIHPRGYRNSSSNSSQKIEDVKTKN